MLMWRERRGKGAIKDGLGRGESVFTRLLRVCGDAEPSEASPQSVSIYKRRVGSEPVAIPDVPPSQPHSSPRLNNAQQPEQPEQPRASAGCVETRPAETNKGSLDQAGSPDVLQTFSRRSPDVPQTFSPLFYCLIPAKLTSTLLTYFGFPLWRICQPVRFLRVE